MFEEENRKKIIIGAIFLLVLIFIFLILSSLGNKKEATVEIRELVLSQKDINLGIGESYQLIPDLYPSDADHKNITYSSSDKNIAVVDAMGIVTALRAGDAIITATAGNGVSDYIYLKVNVGSNATTGLALNMENVSLKVGTKKRFELSSLPVKENIDSITWSIDNPKIASIEQDGEIFGIAPGSTKVTAHVTQKNSNVLSISSNVTVVKETKLSLASGTSNSKMYPYQEKTITVNISDSSVDVINIDAYTDDVAIVTVKGEPKIDENKMISFVVRALAPGETTAHLTVQTAAGENISLNPFSLKVSEFSSLNTDKNSISLFENESSIINVRVSPETAGVLSNECTTSDTSIIQVSATNANVSGYNGACYIKGLKKGTANVDIKMEGKTKTVKVYVNSNTVNTTGINLNRNDVDLALGQTLRLTATVLPSNATDQSVQWSSSDSTIATVSDGIVTPKKVGKVTITAKASGGQTATAKVNVIDSQASIADQNILITDISLSPKELTVEINNTATIMAIITPTNATNKNLTWKSANANIAQVNGGVVKGIRIGNTTITATTPEGKKATINVKVVNGSASGLAEKILADNEIQTGKNNIPSAFSSMEASGLYETTKTSDGNPSYYFRGNVNNNYVKFADKMWRIVRINEDNTVRIILDDSITSGKEFNTKCEGNAKYMYYSNSTIKPTIESWYSKNLSKYSDSYIAKTTFCEKAVVSKFYNSERLKFKQAFYDGNCSASKISTSCRPLMYCYKCDELWGVTSNAAEYTNVTLDCSKKDTAGHGSLSLYVGLITYEEVVYAGGQGEEEADFWLNSGDNRDMMTMSPAGYGPQDMLDTLHSNIWGFNYQEGRLHHRNVDEKFVVSPVINLVGTVDATGTGTQSNPYVIE